VDYLFSAWDKVAGRLKAKPLYLFFDYDGTLAELAESPQKAVMPDNVRAALAGLAKAQDTFVAIVSGRMLVDLKKAVGIDGLVYAGNHGLELEGGGLHFSNGLDGNIRFAAGRIALALKEALRDIDGVLIEDKGLSVSVHYRHVLSQYVSEVRRVVDRTMIYSPDRSGFALHHGKMVFEIRPISKFNKGSVVMWLLRQTDNDWRDKFTPLYIGDDITDEDAFIALRESGITVRVGKSDDSAAQYYLNHTGDVSTFLSRLFALR